jgi:hypothetical protein
MKFTPSVVYSLPLQKTRAVLVKATNTNPHKNMEIYVRKIYCFGCYHEVTLAFLLALNV